MNGLKKIRVGVLFGGKSAEHEVSLLSAKNVIESLDKDKYEVVPIGIDKQGEWHIHHEARFLSHGEDLKAIQLCGAQEEVSLLSRDKSQLLDVILPILHGTNGEDGTVQGLLKLAGIAFVGAGVLGSAVGMDKDVMKRLLRDAGLPIPKFFVFTSQNVNFVFIKEQLGLPFFVKPANLGSSIGISKVKKEEDFSKALEEAFAFDRKILIEEYIDGKEIECAVIGNEHPFASLPGEVIPQDEFHSYRAKYRKNGILLEIPAQIDPEVAARIQALAVQTYQTLCCEGMARIDFFLRGKGEIFINELNTIPGFTRTSVFPKLWEASGLALPDLLDRLIQSALDRFQKEKALITHRSEEYV